MFGFKSKKSPLRRRLKAVLGVKRTWYEWSFEDGASRPTLVVEYEYDTDPTSPDFDPSGIEDICRVIRQEDPAMLTRTRIMPRMYET